MRPWGLCDSKPGSARDRQLICFALGVHAATPTSHDRSRCEQQGRRPAPGRGVRVCLGFWQNARARLQRIGRLELTRRISCPAAPHPAHTTSARARPEVARHSGCALLGRLDFGSARRGWVEILYSGDGPGLLTLGPLPVVNPCGQILVHSWSSSSGRGGKQRWGLSGNYTDRLSLSQRVSECGKIVHI